MPTEELERLIASLEEEMHQAAKDLRFEYAARLRDEVHDLRKELKALREAGVAASDAPRSCAPRSRGSARDASSPDVQVDLRGRTSSRRSAACIPSPTTPS